MSKSVKQMLKQARPPVDAFKVILDMGDGLYHEVDELVAEYGDMAEDDEKAPAIRERISELVNRLDKEATIHGTLTKMPYMQWESFKADFPPRDGNEADSIWGVNTSDFFPAAVRKAMLTPELDAEDWELFSAGVTGGDWVRLAGQVFALNERPVSAPKLPRDFLKTQPRAVASKPPPRLA